MMTQTKNDYTFNTNGCISSSCFTLFFSVFFFYLAERASEREWKKIDEWNRKRAFCVRLQILCATKIKSNIWRRKKKSKSHTQNPFHHIDERARWRWIKNEIVFEQNSKMIEMKRHIDRNKIDISRKRFVVVIESQWININFSRMNPMHGIGDWNGDGWSERNYWIFFSIFLSTHFDKYLSMIEENSYHSSKTKTVCLNVPPRY